MNRTILFRGKRTDNEEWLEGSLITGVFFRDGKDIPYILDADTSEYDCFIYEVDSETVCQLTGLTDKNGKKIWENDIVKIKFENPDGELNHYEYQNMKIVWDSEYLRWIYADKCSDMDSLGECYPDDIEVIGNIFDNPELLKED